MKDRRIVGEIKDASMNELIKSTKETCELISENIDDWVGEDDSHEIENVQKELPYLSRILREIHKRVVIKIQSQNKEESSLDKMVETQEDLTCPLCGKAGHTMPASFSVGAKFHCDSCGYICDISNAVTFQDREEHAEKEVLVSVVPALEDMARDAARKFLSIPVHLQIKISLGFVSEKELKERRPFEGWKLAFQRAVDQGKIKELFEKINEAFEEDKK